MILKLISFSFLFLFIFIFIFILKFLNLYVSNKNRFVNSNHVDTIATSTIRNVISTFFSFIHITLLQHY